MEVRRDAMGEMSVDFGEYGWFPDVLPSEDTGAAVKEEDEEDEEEEDDEDEEDEDGIKKEEED